PRPQPWQGCALPTELFPPLSSTLTVKSISLNAVAKVVYFFYTANFFGIFFTFFSIFSAERMVKPKQNMNSQKPVENRQLYMHASSG
ncbi:hypothetical protein, partial [Xylanibacter caecicola]|uniref:hypothetical protein n=1 Tax=Xylanibacter caecicola TaxID=2736294 RepID=UPI0025998A53